MKEEYVAVKVTQLKKWFILANMHNKNSKTVLAREIDEILEENKEKPVKGQMQMRIENDQFVL